MVNVLSRIAIFRSAWLCQPNIWLHAAFGKLLFAAADVGVGWLLFGLIRA